MSHLRARKLKLPYSVQALLESPLRYALFPFLISHLYDDSKHWPTSLSTISSLLNTTARSEVAADMRRLERTGKATLILLSWQLIGYIPVGGLVRYTADDVSRLKGSCLQEVPQIRYGRW